MKRRWSTHNQHRVIAGLTVMATLMSVVVGVPRLNAEDSTGTNTRLENGQTNQAGPGTSSANFGVQNSVGGIFQSAQLSSASGAIQAQTGSVAILVAASSSSGQAPLDIAVLYAQTQAGLTIPPKTWQSSADPIFYWNPPAAGMGAVAGYSYALDVAPDHTIDTTGTSWNAAQGAAFTNGTHTFSVKAIGMSGLAGKVATFEMWVDALAPAVGGVTPSSGTLLNTLAPTLTMSLIDAHSGIDPQSLALVINGSATTLSYNATAGVATASGASLLDEGINTLTLNAKDLAGNAMAPFIWSLTADVTPPTGTVAINGGSLLTTSVYVTLNLTASDAIAGVAGMLISNDPLIGYVQEPFVSVRDLWRLNAVKGVQSVYVKFIDGAGNVSQAVTDDIGLDLLSPETVIISGPAGMTPSPSAEFTFMCPEGGCVFSYAFDNQEWSTWSADTVATTTSLLLGNHYFRVKAAKESNGTTGMQLDEEDPTPAERTWIVGVESGVVIPPGPPIKVWRVE